MNTQWKCDSCGRWWEQNIKPEGMNQITCPECGNSHWIFVSQEDAEKIKVN